MIPPYDTNGNLPQGIHIASWGEIVCRFGTNSHRRRLLRGLYRALQSLINAGCEVIYIDGSFVTAKEEPLDFDCCWEVDSVALDLLDEVLTDFTKGQARQKRKFGGELFPLLPALTGEQTILEWFQTDKHTGKAKGIVCLRLREIDD